VINARFDSGDTMIHSGCAHFGSIERICRIQHGAAESAESVCTPEELVVSGQEIGVRMPAGDSAVEY